MYYFDPYNVLLVIANIPQRLKTGFVLQGQIHTQKIKLRIIQNIKELKV